MLGVRNQYCRAGAGEFTWRPGTPPPTVDTDEEVQRWFEEVVLPTCEVWVANSTGEAIALMVLNQEWIDQLYVDPLRRVGASVAHYRLCDEAASKRTQTLDLSRAISMPDVSMKHTVSSSPPGRQAITRNKPRTCVTSGRPSDHAPAGRVSPYDAGSGSHFRP